MYKQSLLIFILLLTFSCEKALEYKHQEKADILPCTFENSELIKEALYEFEDYIIKNYPYRDLHNVFHGYTNYWHVGASDFPPKTDSLSAHAKNIMNTLIQKNILLKKANGKVVLNADTPVASCIADNINEEGLKTTFNALLDANSLRSELFIPAIGRRSDLFVKDKALSTYIALDLFYGKLANTDLTISDKERFDAYRANLDHSNHDGHNH